MKVLTVKEDLGEVENSTTKVSKVLASDSKTYYAKGTKMHLSGTNINLEVFSSELLSYLILKEVGVPAPNFALIKVRKKDDTILKKGVHFASEYDEKLKVLNRCNGDTIDRITRKNVEEIFNAAIAFAMIGVNRHNKDDVLVNEETDEIKFFDFSHTDISEVNNIEHPKRWEDHTYLTNGIFYKVAALNIDITEDMINEMIERYDKLTLEKIKLFLSKVREFHDYPYEEELLKIFEVRLKNKQKTIRTIANKFSSHTD